MKKIYLSICCLLILLAYPVLAQLSANTLEFDGADDIVLIPALNTTPWAFGTGDFTVEAFFKSYGPATLEQCIVGSGSATISLYIDPSGYLKWSYFGTLSAAIRYVADAQCHHAAAVKKNGLFYLYIDGDSIPLGINNNIPLSIYDFLYLGGLNAPVLYNIEPLFGHVKEVRLWNTARSTQQIRSNMTAIFNNLTPNLVGNWRCNEGQGNVIHDYSSTANNGVRGDANVPTSVPAWTLGCTTCAPFAYLQSTGQTTFCSGDSVKLQAASQGNVAYIWKKNGNLIPGAQSISYTAKITGQYSVEISNNCGASFSNAISVTANNNPSPVVTSAGPTSFCSGGSVMLSTTNTSGASYLWKKSGVVIPGANSFSYTASATGNYKVVKTNASGCKGTSAVAAVITVFGLPTASLQAQGPTTFCTGDSVELKTPASSGYSYIWKKNNVNISGASQANYYAKTQGSYKVKVTNSQGCTKISNAISVTVPCRDGYFDKGILSFELSPNPSSYTFTLHLNSPAPEMCLFFLFDVAGRLIAEDRINSDLNDYVFGADLNPGMYLIKIKINENYYQQRIIKTQ